MVGRQVDIELVNDDKKNHDHKISHINDINTN